ncbi:phosphate ABC transporter membrane protein 1, PhoT family [Candidatus Koribacter versatilis Ellin345]|uniref:Phosphate transport system permease protein n=1 Tax=Koribacter versatilis (strain Ellin345) TaxID=204669 RepID=Q1IMC5_KORVE|nr:phosphate ABC transporter permease subunit PstC [Candidatus Koribacter versatilis]ABF41975.1 phosphate ABC transporter membrane protein 1, PhoT family [Candidatus Koribacter versatilis Ellin345]
MAASEVPSNSPAVKPPKVATTVEIPKPKPESLKDFGVLGQSRFGSSAGVRVADNIFRGAMLVSALSIFGIVLLVLWELIQKSQMTLHQFGWKFFIGSDWDPVAGNFGALPFIYGTIVSSILALIIAVPLSVGVAVFTTEMCPKALRTPISFMVELLAAIPSVIYGLWAIFVLAPLLRNYVQPWLAKTLGWTGLFSGPPYGIGMLAAGVILAIMIIPIIASVTREVLIAVPQNQREGVLALGATRWEMIRTGVLRNARIGIVGGVILGLGRALGETMAVTMVIGNRPEIAKSLFAPGYTMASVIANEFSEASDDLYLSALVEIGLALFIVTMIVNALARLLVWSITRGTPARAHA